MYTFKDFVRRYKKLMGEAARMRLPSNIVSPQWPLVSDAVRVLIVSAHPDDEILTGMPLGLRYRERGYRVVNVAVTLGRPEQVDRRRTELEGACAYLGIELRVPLETGLRAHIKSNDSDAWQVAMEAVRAIVAEIRPQVVITHHEDDGHPDHCATFRLTRDAMGGIENFGCLFITGEYWRDMSTPNLQLEVSPEHLVHLLNALSFHRGELERNRYDIFWPSLMHLNGRYSEVVMGFGSPAAQFDFSVLYTIYDFREGSLYRRRESIQCAAYDGIIE